MIKHYYVAFLNPTLFPFLNFLFLKIKDLWRFTTILGFLKENSPYLVVSFLFWFFVSLFGMWKYISQFFFCAPHLSTLSPTKNESTGLIQTHPFVTHGNFIRSKGMFPDKIKYIYYIPIINRFSNLLLMLLSSFIFFSLILVGGKCWMTPLRYFCTSSVGFWGKW